MKPLRRSLLILKRSNEHGGCVANWRYRHFFLLTSLQLECPRATERLRVGLPATVEQASHGTHTPSNAPGGAGAAPSTGARGALILAATENFITFLDALKLNMVSKDALHPLLSEVIQSVNKVTERDFENRSKIIQWLIILNQMRATEELSEEQARELAFDIEQAYQGFKATLD